MGIFELSKVDSSNWMENLQCQSLDVKFSFNFLVIFVPYLHLKTSISKEDLSISFTEPEYMTFYISDYSTLFLYCVILGSFYTNGHKITIYALINVRTSFYSDNLEP